MIKYLSDPGQYTTDWVTSTKKYEEGTGFDGKFEESPDGFTYAGSKERYDQFNEATITIDNAVFTKSYAKFEDLEERYIELVDNVAPNTNTGNSRSNIWNNELKAGVKANVKTGEGEVTEWRRLYGAEFDDGEWDSYKSDAAAPWIAMADDFES